MTFHIMFRIFILSNYHKMYGITLKISLDMIDMLFTSSASWNFHENLFSVSNMYGKKLFQCYLST